MQKVNDINELNSRQVLAVIINKVIRAAGESKAYVYHLLCSTTMKYTICIDLF